MNQGVRSAAQAAQDVIVFKALANPVRLQIVSFVAASTEGQVSAGEIVERFSLSQPTISHHLRVLREAGVLTTYKASTFVYYRFAPQLRDTVSAVLPDAAVAEPPAVTTPVRRPRATQAATPAPKRIPAPAEPTPAAEPAPQPAPAPVKEAAEKPVKVDPPKEAVSAKDDKAKEEKAKKDGGKKKDKKAKKAKKK